MNNLQIVKAPKRNIRLVELPYDVAILDEHVLAGEDGTPLFNLNPSRLQKIVDNNNRRVSSTGDMTPLVIGHTKDGAKESEQPEVIGFAHKFSVKPFKNGKKAIFCRWLVYDDKLDLLRRYPRRSVELWLSKMEVDPISLLGASSPDRDLGLVQLQERGLKYQREIDTNMDNSQVVQAVIAALQQTEEWKLLTQLVQEMAAPQPEEVAPQAAPESTPPEMTEEPSMEASTEGVPPGDSAPPPPEEKPAQMSAATSPSGSNTFVPGQAKLRYSAEEIERFIDQSRETAEENKVLQTRMNDLIKLTRRQERDKALISLEAEGYLLDREEELKSAESLDEAQWVEKVGTIRKRYQRAAVNGARLPIATDTELAPAQRAAVVDKAIAESLRTGEDYGSVLNRLRSRA